MSSAAISHEERALDLLVQASRTSPKLREAVAEVEKWVKRLKEDRDSAWQSFEEADVEAQWQMGAKLEAQQALWAIIQSLDLNPAELPAGWAASTKPILARIEAIVDEADRLARERDQAVAALERMETPSRASGGAQSAADIRENLVGSVEQHMIDEFARVTRMNRLTEAEAWEAWAHTEEAVNGFIQDEYDDA